MPVDPQVDAARQLLIAAGQLGQALSEAIREHLGEELTSNAAVVTLLSLEEPGHLRPGQIQDLTGLSSGGVSKLLQRLEDGGLVARSYGVIPGDRRGSSVSLTDDGRRVNKQVAESVAARIGEIRVMLKEMDQILA